MEDDGRMSFLPTTAAKVPDGKEENNDGNKANEWSVEVWLLDGGHQVVLALLCRVLNLKVFLTSADTV